MPDLNFVVKNGITVNGSFTANSTAVNAAAISSTSLTAGANVTVNTTTVFVGTASVNTSVTAGSLLLANSIGNSNITSGSIILDGGAFRANSTVVNAVAVVASSINSTSVNTATANATTSIVVGGNVTVNTTAFFVSNTLGNTTTTAGSLVINGGAFRANSTVVNAVAVVASSINSTSVNTATVNATTSIVVGGNVLVNTTAFFVNNASVNTNITAGQISISGVTVNSTIYQGTANNANNLGGIAAASYVNSAQLSSNLSNYAALAGATFAGPVTVSNTLTVSNNVTVNGNLTVTGTTFYANVTNLDVKDINITVAKGVATASAADGAGITVDVAGATWNYNNGTNSWQTNINLLPSTNNNLNLGNTGLRWANVHANNIVGANLYGTIQTISQPNITAGNSTNLNGLPASSYVNTAQLSSNLGNYAALAGATFAGAIIGSSINATSVNTATANATTSIVVGSNTLVNTTAFFVSNTLGNTTTTAGSIIINNGAFRANSTVVNAVAVIASSVNSASVNTSTANATTSIVVGGNILVNTTAFFVNSGSSNTNITAGQISVSGVTVNSTIYQGTANNANNLGGVAASLHAKLSGATFTGSVNINNTNVSLSADGLFLSNTVAGGTTNIRAAELNIAGAPGFISIDSGAFKANSTAVTVGANVIMSGTSLFVGNTTVNSTLTSASIVVANSTGNATITPGSIATTRNITTPSLNNGPLSGNRNAIINGNFDIWQRGTSFINPSVNTYLADRWLFTFNGSGGARLVARQEFALGQTDVPFNPQYYLTFQQTVAGTGANFNVFQQLIEGVRTFAGQQVSISFYARAASTIILPEVQLRQYFGSGGSPSTFVDTNAVLNQTVTTSWAKYSYTVNLPSIFGKTLGTDVNDYLGLFIALPENQTFTIDIAQVQVEAGPVATPFERRPIGQELLLCQRYFEIANIQGLQKTNTSGNYDGSVKSYQFKATKRANPSTVLNSSYDGLGTASALNVVSAASGTYLSSLFGRSPTREEFIIWSSHNSPTLFDVGDYAWGSVFVSAELF